MSRRKALITGITGQDGSYLAELLLAQTYDVHGIVRPDNGSSDRFSRLDGFRHQLTLHSASLENYTDIRAIVAEIKPDECYHLGAQTVVTGVDESVTLRTNVSGTHHMLSAVAEYAPECRFCFAGTSEMFGRAEESPQSERTAFHPRSVYGISKTAGFHLTRMFREERNLFASTAILFNHESPRRSSVFVTKKISSTVAKIRSGETDKLALGTLDARRDWGHAKEYVQAMALMLQREQPEDFVIATGETHTVREFVDIAFGAAGLDPARHVVQDPRFMRPPEPFVLTGDTRKAQAELGWKATTPFEDIVVEMVRADCRAAGVEIETGQTRDSKFVSWSKQVLNG